MRIDNIHTTETQYYTHIMELDKRWVNYRPSENKRDVTFKYKGNTYLIECNPLSVEDSIIKYIKNEEL